MGSGHPAKLVAYIVLKMDILFILPNRTTLNLIV